MNFIVKMYGFRVYLVIMDLANSIIRHLREIKGSEVTDCLSDC